ncbi:MAG TPA: LysR family transcriptional regulator [Campylobacterales bacterium]|jgi:DNA-binding transcriptional LysR family regulator|nr:LysR family transcriptional regulator [Campylobacterales bacterium]HHD81051.1 LysR family transcriptional regulator [Campylobacterales bacterium]HHH51817.1 LysR family transcriptional regulator [Campylobacterales bacterium]
MKLTLRQMEIFLNVVKQGHLTNVAKGMGLSQSAISMSIKELENILGNPLFDRINKKLILNEMGRSFEKEIAPIVKKLNDIEYEFKNTVNKGIVRVGASTTIVDYLMPPIICNYMNNYPDVKVGLKEGNTKQIVELIKNGEIDVGFVEGIINDSDIIKEIIGVDELVVVTTDTTLTKEISIDKLQDRKWVLREEGSGTREVFLDYIKERVDHINIFLELGHTESIKSLLMNHRCLTCISKIAVQKDIANNKLMRVPIKDFECKRNFFMIYHKDKYHSELFEKFIYFTKTMINQMLEEKY